MQLSEGDTVGMTGEVTLVHDDGTVTVRLHGYDYRSRCAPSISLIAKFKKGGRPNYDQH